MGGKGRKKSGPSVTPGSVSRTSLTLRDQAQGKKQNHVNAKTMLKFDHMKSLAVWAAEASIPPLAAFFGERLAATTEVLAIRNDPSLFTCERCETILQPGNNCTIRVEKIKKKKGRRKKPVVPMTQNIVVSRCHFCSHRNEMNGTPKGYLKEILPPKAKSMSKSAKKVSSKPVEEVAAEVNAVDSATLLPPGAAAKIIAEVGIADSDAIVPVVDQQHDIEIPGPATPSPSTGLSLLDSKRRKRTRSGVKKTVRIEVSADAAASVPSSSKRKKRAWISLKEIAQTNEHNTAGKLANSIPFFV